MKTNIFCAKSYKTKKSDKDLYRRNDKSRKPASARLYPHTQKKKKKKKQT